MQAELRTTNQMPMGKLQQNETVSLAAHSSLHSTFGNVRLIEASWLTVAHMEPVIEDVKINYCMFLQLQAGLCIWILSVGLLCTNHFYCHSKRRGGRKMTPLLVVVGIS